MMSCPTHPLREQYKRSTQEISDRNDQSGSGAQVPSNLGVGMELTGISARKTISSISVWAMPDTICRAFKARKTAGMTEAVNEIKALAISLPLEMAYSLSKLFC